MWWLWSRPARAAGKPLACLILRPLPLTAGWIAGIQSVASQRSPGSGHCRSPLEPHERDGDRCQADGALIKPASDADVVTVQGDVGAPETAEKC